MQGHSCVPLDKTYYMTCVDLWMEIKVTSQVCKDIYEVTNLASQAEYITLLFLSYPPKKFYIHHSTMKHFILIYCLELAVGVIDSPS